MATNPPINPELEHKYLLILKKFFDSYVATLEEYLDYYNSAKIADIENDIKLEIADKNINIENSAANRFSEILGLHTRSKIVPNVQKDNYDYVTHSDDASLSRLIDITDDLGNDVLLSHKGNSLHQAVLNKVIGTMIGTESGLVQDIDRNFNFMALKSDFPELYDALAWAFREQHLSIDNGEITHMAIQGDYYSWADIKNLLDIEGLPSERTPGVDLFRALLVEYDLDDGELLDLTPSASFKMTIGEKIREIIDPGALKVLDMIETDLGGLPGGTVHGGISIQNSTYGNPLTSLGKGGSILEVLLKNIFQMTDEQAARLPDIPDEEVREIANLLDIPLDNMMHLDWEFMQVTTADGFLPILNDPALGRAGDANMNTLKGKSIRPLMKLVDDFMGHFKSHNIPIESSASLGLPHLIKSYQRLGAIIFAGYPELKKVYTAQGTGHDLSTILLLPEYMLNKNIESMIIKPNEIKKFWEEDLRQLTKDFEFTDSQGEPQLIKKGEILIDSDFKRLKELAKRQGIELPESPVDRRRGGEKQGNVAKGILGYAKGAMARRFDSYQVDIERLVSINNMLNRNDVLDYKYGELGFTITEHIYKDWNKAPDNPSIYTDFFTKFRTALRKKGTENIFLRHLLQALLGGEFIDIEQNILAIPIPDEAGFTFINLGQMSEDDMLNLAYIKNGNKNYTPDIYFGGSIGKVNYTPEFVKSFKNILYTQDLLEFFSKNVSETVSIPPIGIEGVKPTASTVYSIQDLFEKSPKTFLKLFVSYRDKAGDEIFNILPSQVLTNINKLLYRMEVNDITIDDLPDVDKEGNAINYSTLMEDTADTTFETIVETLNEDLKKLELSELDDIDADARDRIRARQQRILDGPEERVSSEEYSPSRSSQYPDYLDNPQLIEIIEDADNTITYYDSTHLGRNLNEAANGVDALANFFDLTQYSDYELSVTGLAQGPSHMDGKDINDAKSIIANLVNGNPTVYGNYSFKFLERFDGTTAIAFLNENSKDVFKKNLLISNRIFSNSTPDSNYSINFLDRATVLPNTKILFFDASPVQTNAVFKNKIHMLEFDIGIAERLPNGVEDVNRIYTQVAYSFDEDTGELRIHHYIDNIPNDQNQLSGDIVRRQGNINNIYAIKDSAIIKSLMDLHGVVDETKVVDGEPFIPLSQGVERNYNTVNVIPGRIAHSFGYVESSDPDPDSSMYTKTLGGSNSPFLRSRKIATLWGMFQDFTIGTVIDEFDATENMLRDTDVRLQPVINHPNFYIAKIKNDVTSATGSKAENFIHKASTLFEPFGLKQDNINGFKLQNVHINFVTEAGQEIELVGELNQDLVLTRVTNITSDWLNSDQINTVIEATIKKNYPDLELDSNDMTTLRQQFLTFLELDTTTGKYTLSSLGDSNVGEFKLDKINFIDSELYMYGDTETALEINQVFNDLGFVFDTDANVPGLVHTYNPLVTEIMESNSYMGMGVTDYSTGVQYSPSSDFDDMFHLYVNSIYGSANSSKFYPGGRYPETLRSNKTLARLIANFTNMREPDIVIGPEYTDGLTRHSPVISSDIAKAARLSGSAIKTVLKPVGSAFKLLEKIDVADKIVMKAIKPVSSAIAKGIFMTGGFAAAGTIGAGLATVYAAQELYLLAHGLIKEGDLFGDTQKLFKELRDDNPGDGAWKRFWVSTGKNAWKGLEWQQDHSVSGWVEEQLMSGAGMAFNEIVERRNKNSNYVKEVARFANNNENIFDTVNKYDPQYNENFDNINRHINMSMQNYGTPQHEQKLNKEINNVTKYGVWNNSEDLLYNGNEEFLATVDNYIKLARAYESIGY